MPRWSSSAAAWAAVLPSVAVAFNEVVEFDAYRALPRSDLNRFGGSFSNVDFSDIPGVLEYLHTKAIVEHPDVDTEKNKVETEERTSRLNRIDTIVRLKMKVKNPQQLLAGKQATHVDFGPAVQFVEGEATGAVYKWDYGDFVGAKKHSDQRFETDVPYYWFSFSGFCPNLANGQKRLKLNNTVNENCVFYKDGSGPLMGGLCPGGTAPGAVPTGLPGCSYTYQAPVVPSKDVISLDELTGITKEDCGGRLCKDWLDFRNLCTNKEYRQKFQYSRRRRFSGKRIVPTTVCIEYDIDPDCAEDCESHTCKRLAAHDKELGLPFWRGRCDKEANRERFEKVAAAFGIPGATSKHSLVQPASKPGSCTNQYHTTCQPFPEFGGMYCSRSWAGICQECYISGTVKLNEKAGTTPMCPWDILSTGSYSGSPPLCRSSAPRELCCLYSNSCNRTMSSDPLSAPVNEDGYWLVSAQKNTEAMQSFLERAVYVLWQASVTDPEGIAKVAYKHWNIAPVHGRSFAAALHDVKPFIEIPTTTTPAPTTSGAVLPAIVDSATTLMPNRDTAVAATGGPSGAPWWVWAAAVGGVVTVGVLAAGAYVAFSGGNGGGKSSSKKPRRREHATRGIELEGQTPLVAAPETVVSPAAQYNQPQYNQPQYGQPQYSQPQYGQPQYSQVQYTQVPVNHFASAQPLAPVPGYFPAPSPYSAQPQVAYHIPGRH